MVLFVNELANKLAYEHSLLTYKPKEQINSKFYYKKLVQGIRLVVNQLLDRIKELCKKRGINVYQLEEALGFGRNTIYQWNKRVPGADKLQKVADYFDVSTDYLLGREEKVPQTETDLEKMLESAMSFSGKPMTDHDKEVIMAYLKGKYEIN